MKKKNIDIGMTVLILIFLIVAYCYIQLTVQKKEYVNFCGYTFFRVITGSMANTIQINDVVIVKITDDIKENDIITYKSDNNFITHRVVKINKSNIITQGDANNTEDEPIKMKDVLGKVVVIIPVCILMKVFSSPEVIGATIFSMFMLWVLFHKKKEKIVSKEDNDVKRKILERKESNTSKT